MYLVISLTVADMLVGLLSESLFPLVYMRHRCDLLRGVSLDGKIETLLEVTIPVLPLVSLTNIAVISLERTHATFRPFKHRVIKKWVYEVIIATVWVLPVMILSAAVSTFSMIFQTTYLSSGQYTIVVVCLLSVFRTLVFQLNLCVGHIPRTMEQ